MGRLPPVQSASLLRLGREGDFGGGVRKKPEAAGQKTAHVSRVDGTKGRQGANGGTGQFDRTLDEFALSAPRLPPARPKSRHTPEKIAVFCPPSSAFFRPGYGKVPFPSQAEQTGGLDWRQAGGGKS